MPANSTNIAHPRFLPDGKHFLYLLFDNDPEKTGTYFASLDGRDQHLVIGGYESVVYSAGFLLYLREGTLVAQAFDADRGQFTSNAPRAVVDGVAFNTYFHYSFDGSDNGVLVYRRRNEAYDRRLTWFDRNDRKLDFIGEPAP